MQQVFFSLASVKVNDDVNSSDDDFSGDEDDDWRIKTLAGSYSKDRAKEKKEKRENNSPIHSKYSSCL